MEDIFKRKIEVYAGSEHCTSNIPDGYFIISADRVGSFKKYSEYFEHMKKARRESIIDMVNKVSGKKLLE